MPDQPKDIFAEVAPVKTPTVTEKLKKPQPVPPRLPLNSNPRSDRPTWLWVVIGVLLLLVILAAAVVYMKRFKKTDNSNTNTQTALVNTNANSANANVNANQTSPINFTLQDTDHDGLTDAEETKLGTNPKLADTDRDGLSDLDETKVYHSDPLKPDTDGDGNSDGQEVKMGYNPNGPGKLLDFQAAKNKLSNSNSNTNQ